MKSSIVLHVCRTPPPEPPNSRSKREIVQLCPSSTAVEPEGHENVKIGLVLVRFSEKWLFPHTPNTFLRYDSATAPAMLGWYNLKSLRRLR